MPHADEGRLHAYLDGALHAEDPEAARALERHLDACDDCRARLDAERAVRDEASALLGLSLPAAASAAPPWEEVLHRAGRGPGAGAGNDGPDGPRGEATDGALRRPPGRIRWLPAGRPLAWAASVILALGVGWWSHAALGADPFERSLAAPRADRAQTAEELAPGGGVPEAGIAAEAFEAEGSERDASSETEARPRSPQDQGRAEAAGQPEPSRELEAAGQPEAAREPAPSPETRAANAPQAQVERLESGGLADSVAKALAGAPIGAARASADTVEIAGRAVEGARLRAAPRDRRAGEPAAADPALEERQAAADELVERRVDVDADGWEPVDVAGARGLLGRAPVGVPGAEVLAIAWGAGGRTLRVTQLLASGERIDLYQWSARASDGAGPVFGGELADSVPRREGGIIRGYGSARPISTVLVDGLLVAGSGAVGADELRALLEGLAPLPAGS